MNSTGDQRTEEIAERVEGWLREEGWITERRSLPGLSWGLNMKDEHGREMFVGQRVTNRDQIIIQTGVAVSEPHQQALSRLSPRERSALLWDLQLRLMQMDLLFGGISDPLKSVMITQRIYYDGLTKDAFLQRVTRVLNGMLTVGGMISQRFNEAPPSGQTTNPIVH